MFFFPYQPVFIALSSSPSVGVYSVPLYFLMVSRPPHRKACPPMSKSIFGKSVLTTILTQGGLLSLFQVAALSALIPSLMRQRSCFILLCVGVFDRVAVEFSDFIQSVVEAGTPFMPYWASSIKFFMPPRIPGFKAEDMIRFMLRQMPLLPGA